MIVLYTDTSKTRRVILKTSQATCTLESVELTEDGEVVTESVVLNMQTVAKLIPIFTTFVADRPKQVHNNIEWSVQKGVVMLNDVPVYHPLGGWYNMRVAGELVSRLLTADRTLNLFNDIPQLTDMEAELWIVERIQHYTQTLEF